MKKIALSLLALASFLFASQAFAHVSYRDLDTSNSIVRTVTGNVGWSDAADGDWGDSHKGAWYKFSLTEDSLVSISVTGLNAGTYGTINASGSPVNVTSAFDLTDVGFTLYRGLFPAGAYDTAAALPVPSGKDGRWDALGDTSMANNSNVIGTVEYVTHVNDSTSNIETLINFFLTAGNYTIGAGGSLGATGTQVTLAPSEQTGSHALRVELNVQPVPVPAAAWLFGSAIAGLIGVGKRKRSIV